jgi:hypothetical protein
MNIPLYIVLIGRPFVSTYALVHPILCDAKPEPGRLGQG